MGWTGMILIDKRVFVFMGDPVLDDGTRPPVATQTSFYYTATKSVFSFEAAGIHFNATFFSPITPHDLLRMSMPLSYLTVEVDSQALKNHRTSVYTDITGEWASGDSNVEIKWTYSVHAGVEMYEIERKDPQIFGEFGEQAEWGSAILAVQMADGVTTSSGPSIDVRSTFARKHRLNAKQDVRYRAINNDYPAFAFAKDLTDKLSSITFTVGHMRTPYVNYVTAEGQIDLQGYWSKHFHGSILDAVAFWVQDHTRAVHNGETFDRILKSDAHRVSGSNYSAIVELSTRQAFASIEVTEGFGDQEAFVFLKEISSNGDMSTVDVIFPMYPILAYTNPELIKLVLDPIMIYSASGLDPNKWTVHDLGTYPNATGYNGGNDEPMPVEEAGNMLWMILAYWQHTRDTSWIEQYYPLLKQWAMFLVEDGLIPADQLSTDDFAGRLSNQTNLAVKAIVGIGAMAQLARATDRFTDFVHFDATARAYSRVWNKLAIDTDAALPHTKPAYQDEDSWGVLYNLLGDRILNLKVFDKDLYRQQTAFYRARMNEYGVPLDSRHFWTKTDWEMFAAASATDASARDLFVDALVAYLKRGKVDAPFPDLYETTTANFAGREGLDFSVMFLARPVVGGHFALLALEAADEVNGVSESYFV